MSARALGLIYAAAVSASAFADPAFYAGGSAGLSKAKFGTEFNSTAAVSLDDRKTSSTAVKLFAGYEMSRHLALEGGFARLGSPTVRTHDNATGATLQREFKPQSWNISIKGAATPTDALSVFGKLGLTRNIVKVYSSPAGTDEPSRGRSGLMYGAGVSYAVSKNVSVRAEYEDFGRFGKDPREDPNGIGSLKLSLYSAGLAYSFR